MEVPNGALLAVAGVADPGVRRSDADGRGAKAYGLQGVP